MSDWAHSGPPPDDRRGGRPRDDRYRDERRERGYDRRDERYDERRRDYRRDDRGRDDRFRDRGSDRGDRGEQEENRHKRKRSPSPETSTSFDPAKRQKTGWDQGPSFGGPKEGGEGTPFTGGPMPTNPDGTPVPFSMMFPYLPNPANRQARRLYVGNLPPGVTGQQIIDFMNDKIMNGPYERDPNLGPPVYLAEVNNEKSYAFVEFKTAKDASIGMAHDGITLFGQALRIRRPKDYVPSGSEDERVVFKDNMDIISTNVADTPHKLYIGGIPTHLTEEDIKELLGVFGKLRAFNLVRDSQTSASKGFAFCEYVDVAITDTVVNKLNGLKVGDKTLSVARAMLGRMGADGSSAGTIDALIAAEPEHKMAAAILQHTVPLVSMLQNLQINGAVISPADPTRILVILNALDIVDEWTDDYYAEVLEDFEVESRRFGNVVSILIPRPEKKKAEEPTYLRPLSAAEYQAQQQEEEAAAKAESAKKQQAKDDLLAAIKKQEAERDQEPTQPTEPVAVQGPQEPKTDNPAFKEPAFGFGKIFIEYSTKEEAARAQREFAGRRFDGRMLLTSYYPENMFPPTATITAVPKPEPQAAAAKTEPPM